MSTIAEMALSAAILIIDTAPTYNQCHQTYCATKIYYFDWLLWHEISSEEAEKRLKEAFLAY